MDSSARRRWAQSPNQLLSEGVMETARPSSIQQAGGDAMVDDRPSSKLSAESQKVSYDRDVDEDAMVATPLETKNTRGRTAQSRLTSSAMTHRGDRWTWLEWKPRDKRKLSSWRVLECGKSHLDRVWNLESPSSKDDGWTSTQVTKIARITAAIYVCKRNPSMAKGSLIAEFFSAMPPLSCSELLFALAWTDRYLDENGVWTTPQRTKCVKFVDVERGRSIAVELPTELRKSDVHEVGLRKKGDVWHEREPPCAGRWRSGVLARPRAGMQLLQQRRTVASQCARRCPHSVGIRAWSGVFCSWVGRNPGSTQELRYLNRLISWTRKGIFWELYPRHVGSRDPRI